MAYYERSYKNGEATGITIEIEQRETDLGSCSPELVSVSTSWITCFKVPDIYRLLSMQTYKSQQQLVNMVGDVKLNLQELASKPVETTSRHPPDSDVHLDALKLQARALARNIQNHAMKIGLERAMDFAFVELTNPAERNLRRKSAFLENVNYSFSTINTPFGKINIRITTLSFENDTYKMRTNLIIHPFRFSQLCGVNFCFRIALSNSYGAFKHELKAYRAVPDDATIFRLCRERQIDVIRHLFDEGLASPLDTDSFGRTPLMVRPRHLAAW